MSHINLFISTVSGEFGSYRSELHRYLTRPNVAVKIQEDFGAGGVETVHHLAAYVEQCDAVVHLAGGQTGYPINKSSQDWLKARYPTLATDFPALSEVLDGTTTASYTQWEAYLALIHNKMLLVARPTDEALRDNIPSEIPTPVQDQEQHLKRIRALGRYPEINFRNADNLVAQLSVSGLNDLLLKANVPAPVQPRNLPYDSLGSLFKGREPFIQTLREKLLDKASGPHKAVYGLGGIGKTRLAVEYAWQHQNAYTALLFVRADTPADLEANIAGLCSILIPNQPNLVTHEQKEQLQATLTWLEQHPDWLLIIDNVDTIKMVKVAKEWLRRLGKGHVLLTSRISEWGKYVECLEVKVLTPEDAQAFLQARTPHRRTAPTTDEADSLALAHDLGYLSLALETAGAYIDVNHITLQEYRAKWATNAEDIRAWFEPDLIEDYDWSVAVTWHTSFKQLGPAAQTLLNRLAWLSAEPIPLTLLDVPIPDTNPLNTVEALHDLVCYSLLAYSDNYNAFSVHRLVQQVARDLQGTGRELIFIEVLKWMDIIFTGDSRDVRLWSVSVPLLSHALTVSACAEEFGFPVPASRLLNNLGLLLIVKGQINKAEPLLRRALAITEAQLGPKHPDVATSLNSLAGLLLTRRYELEEGQLSEAESLLRRALVIDEASIEPDAPNVARDLSNLAELMRITNRKQEAETLMRRALAIDEAQFGPNDPIVALRLSNLATLLHETKRSADAEVLLRRALAIDEANSASTQNITNLNNLANLLYDSGRYDEAQLLFRQVLAIAENYYDADHPTLAIYFGNLANPIIKSNSYSNNNAEAESLVRKALAINKANFNPVAAAKNLNQLEFILKKDNRLEELELLLRQTLDTYKASLNSGHTAIGMISKQLSRLLQDSNRLTEAESFLRQAIAIDRIRLGHYHPDVANSLANLAVLLKITNHPDEAEALYHQALTIGLLNPGYGDFNVGMCLNNLGRLLQDAKRPEEAEPLFRHALAIAEKSDGPDYNNAPMYLSNLARVLVSLNRLTEAEPLFRRALAITEASDGPNHPTLALRLNNLATLLEDDDRSDEAELLYRRSVSILISFYHQTGQSHTYFQRFTNDYINFMNNLNYSSDLIYDALESLGIVLGGNKEESSNS